LRLRPAAWLIAFLLLAPVGAAAERLPIVFVHGNGDSKAVWTTTLWRFESNGYPRNRLFAVELERPTATDVYNVPQPGRSTAVDVRRQLARFVQTVRARTGARKVVLVGNSRGANTIRNYLENGGGAAVTAKVVLGGGVNHGVVDSTAFLVGSEFNGSSAFMQGLNDGPNETVPGVPFLTLRSDRFDKFAQPDGRFLGLPGVPTGIGFAAPALDGARNLVLPGVDHRETSFSPQAFARTWRFVTGTAPRTLGVRQERGAVPLSGTVTGVVGGVLYDNRRVAGARLRVFAVDQRTGQRRGGPAYVLTTRPGGAWGPFRADPRIPYEFELRVRGQPVTHIYRSPFPRGSSLVTLRPALASDAAPGRGTVIMTRPRGYFGIEDKVRLGGVTPAPGLPADPVPNVASLRLDLPIPPQQAVWAQFDAERITARTWPAGEVSFAEFHF
jgi:pimeloyl-ACP methyl ester carboxylesterase